MPAPASKTVEVPCTQETAFRIFTQDSEPLVAERQTLGLGHVRRPCAIRALRAEAGR